MRILHINGNYLFSKLHQNLIRELSRQSIENGIFVPMYDRSRAIYEPQDDVVASECFKKWDRLFFDYKQSKIIREAEARFNVAEFDIIHAYTLFTDGNCAMRLAEKYDIPYVVAVRNTDVNDFMKIRPLLRGRGVKIMRRASAVFFLSETYKTEVFEKYVPKEYRDEIAAKSHIIPNGIDSFWLENIHRRERKPEKEIKIIYAGRINKNKNITTTQKAIKILQNRGIAARLTVVGAAESKAELERIIADPSTEYFEAMPKERLAEMYRKNDIFVMPSFTETFGLVYAEAMSQGTPVVYSAGQGFDGQFPDGEVGFAVDSGSAEAVADAVIKITENYETISANCCKGALKFDWEFMAQRYFAIYRDILQTGG